MSDLAAQLAEDAAGRLVRYARIDTQSDEDSETYPSTEKQLELLRLLLDELKQLGLEDAGMDEHGYVTATIPATVGPQRADDRVLRARRHRARGDRRERAPAARPVRGRGPPARHVGPHDPAGGVAAARASRRPRDHHHRRHDAPRGRRQGGDRRDHGRDRLPARTPGGAARPGEGRLQPGRGGRARRDPLPRRDLRGGGRLHDGRLDRGRDPGGDVLRRAGAHAHPRARRSIPGSPRASW